MADFNDLVSLLDEVGPALLSADDSAGLSLLCSVARTAMGAAACSVSVLDEPAGELRYVASAGAGADEIVGTRLALGRGIAGFVASSGQGLSISDVRRDTRFAGDVAQATGYVPTAMLAVPISTGDRTMGVLSVLDASRADMSLAAGFASIAAATLHQATTAAALGKFIVGALATTPTPQNLPMLYEPLRIPPQERRPTWPNSPRCMPNSHVSEQEIARRPRASLPSSPRMLPARSSDLPCAGPADD